MDFSSMEKAVYGANVEDDDELMAELLALQQEEDIKQRRAAPPRPAASSFLPTAPVAAAPQKASTGHLDPAMLAAALSDVVDDGDADGLEEDTDLLDELSGLVGAEEGTEAPPPPPTRQAPTASAIQKATNEDGTVRHLKELSVVYQKMLAASQKEGNSAKARRHQRTVEKLNELIGKASRGQSIDPSEIPPAPPSFQSNSDPPPRVQAPPVEQQPPPIPTRTAPPPMPARTAPPTEAPPPRAAPTIPARNAAPEPAPSIDISKRNGVLQVLVRRRDAYVANGRAAAQAQDRAAATEYVQTAKMFDQAIAALDSVSVDEIDMSEVPPSPVPYRKVEQPKTFMEGLTARKAKFLELAEKAKKEGNDRKARMNERMAGQYSEAIADARAGRAVVVADLPATPDMTPLLPQFGGGGGGGGGAKPSAVAVPAAATGPAPGMKPAPAVGVMAPSGVAGQSRNASQLEFLLQRQHEFKQAAFAAKKAGNVELAKKYLLESKGFDKMITAARAGMPVSIKDTPIPPQSSTSQVTLQPRIQVAEGASGNLEGRGEVLSMLEKGLIEQIQLAENNRLRFTRLGDVGKVKLFEGWAKASKQDLLLVRGVAKQGLRLPKFHHEMRQIPSADLFPDLAEDVMELTIVNCKDVPLPAGYEPTHANVFVKYDFPYPADAHQVGKSKLVAGTQSPEYNETVIFQIGSRKTRGMKLARVLKRATLKLEVYQKGGFLRSDKLMGTCEWKLEKLESSAELEESLPLKDGRKAVGGLLSLRIRVREPIGDSKLVINQHKWLILDN